MEGFFPVLEVFDKSCMSDQPDELTETYPEVFPACAVTRAQARKRDDFELSSSFIAPIFTNDVLPQVESKAVEKSSPVSLNRLKLPVTRDKIVSAQSIRCNFAEVFLCCCSLGAGTKEKSAYFVEDGLLMRRWCPDVKEDSEWDGVYQVVIPSCCRQQVLFLAHDHDLSGHLGVKKTYTRILRHFFWPRLKTDVANFCRTCCTCQITGKPNQVIPPAPLVPIPVVGETV